MLKILASLGGTRNDRFAVQHVIKRFMNDTAMEVHLAQRPEAASPRTSRASRVARARQDYHREQAEKALAPVKEMLDKFSIPYAAHMQVGDRREDDNGHWLGACIATRS